jgi:TM2 domain-containing membrane protein YozV
MALRNSAFAAALFMAVSLSAQTTPDSITALTAQRDSAAHADTEAVRARDTLTHNPVLAGALSAVLPGAGQIYDHHYVKGALYLLTEAGLVSYAVVWYGTGSNYNRGIARLDSVYNSFVGANGKLDTSAYREHDSTTHAGIDSTDTVTIYRLCADTARYKRDRRYYIAYQAAAWAAGVYLYAIMDALEKSNRFRNDAPRNPTLAGWLSAVPGLGLGQLYNGKLSKAGMIWMVQWSLGYMALNNQLLLTRCETALRDLTDSRTAAYAATRQLPSPDALARDWDNLRQEAFRKRNTYLWYSLFFYLYGVFDAVVDAHLHDYPRRMRLEPDLAIESGAVGLKLNITY